MGYFDKGLFTFLEELKNNNDRTWFTANKDRFERDVREPYLEFIEDLGPRLGTISKNIVADSRSLFRIYRDVRFSKDNRVHVKSLPSKEPRPETGLRRVG